MTTVQNIAYGNVYTGEHVGVTSATQLTSRTCRMVMFTAAKSNNGNVYLGGSGVTVAAGTTTTTAGYELQPGGQTPWIPIRNMNLIYMISDGVTDDLLWMAIE